jgi:enoyl-CoA hydratase
MDEQLVLTEKPSEGIARIVLDRPAKRNAQTKAMIYQLNDAFTAAAQDDEVKVIILAARGPHFSAGHDLSDYGVPMDAFSPVTTWGGFSLPGAEGYMAVEQEIYLGMCWRWRNIPKPTIAQVQGKVIAGGLMLVWPCDLVVASSDATFADPVVVFGVNGHEYFTHVWELGARRAKELLFTGAAITAEEAYRIGMVNKVVEGDELEAATLELAEHIARRPGMGLKLAKQAVNQSLDAQGQWQALQAAFSLHQLGHSHNREVHGFYIHPDGAEIIRAENRPPTA